MNIRRLVFGAAFVMGLPNFAAGAATPGAPAAAASTDQRAAPAYGAVAAAPSLPAGVSEVMKLFRAGLSAGLIVNYINNSALSFYLSADTVIYLQQQGVSEQVVQAMLQRNGDLSRQSALATQQALAGGGAFPASPQVQIPSEAPPPTYYAYPDASYSPPAAVAPAYPNYYSDYYFDYNYPYLYWPPVYYGNGLGFYSYRLGGYGGRYYGGGRVGGGRVEGRTQGVGRGGGGVGSVGHAGGGGVGHVGGGGVGHVGGGGGGAHGGGGGHR
jgi:hypothetical protein